MLEMSGPEIDLDELLAQARAEVSAKRAGLPTSKAVPGVERKSTSSQMPQAIELKLAAEKGVVYGMAFQPPVDGRYRVKDLLEYYDRDFLHAAYRAVLQRAPDEEGMTSYLAHLRNGMSRVEVLEALRSSAEGLRVNARVRGLSREVAVLRMSRRRLIGPIVRLLVTLRDLPDAERRRRVLEGQILARIEAGQLNAQEAHRSVNSALREVAEAYGRLLTYTASKADRVDVGKLEEAIGRVTETLTSTCDTMSRKGDASDLGRLEVSVMELSGLLRALERSKAEASELRRVGASLENISRALATLETTKADQLALAQTRELLIGALEARPERQELTVLANQLIAASLTRFNGEVIAPLEQDYTALRRCHEADRARTQIATDQLKASIEVASADARKAMEASVRGRGRVRPSTVISKE